MLVCLLLAASRADAQAASESSARWERMWGGGLHFFGPVGTSLAIGGGFRHTAESPEARSRSVFALLEPGIGGQRVSLGYAESLGHLAGGWSARGTVLKLTGERARRTLAGVEVQAIALLCAGVRVGAFRPLTRGEPRSTIFLADLSICL